MTSNLTIGIAFFAGIVSFLAPCVLPLVPGYLAYLAGSTSLDDPSRKKTIFVNSIFFVLGFSVLFSILGILLNTILESIAYDVQIWLARIGGALIIFFGLYLVGLIHIGFLAREHKLRLTKRFNSRYLTSFLFGAAFAAGWTPCVGAVLGSILGLAVTQPGSAFSLLLAYSFGLGLPFLLVGAFTSQASGVIAKFSRWLKPINIIFGVLLIVLGVLVFTQSLNLIANFDFVNAIIQG